jgi:hypothetical protein
MRDDPWRSIAAFIRQPERVKVLGYTKPVIFSSPIHSKALPLNTSDTYLQP